MDKDTPRAFAAGQRDGEATAQKTGAEADYHMVDLRKISQNAVNRHPEPVCEPVPPAEVFYHKMELDEDFDPHS